MLVASRRSFALSLVALLLVFSLSDDPLHARRFAPRLFAQRAVVALKTNYFHQQQQVLACCDSLDTKFKSWPSKLTVFNYGVWFENNNILKEDNSSDIVDGKKWFIASYNCNGAEGGIVNGSVSLHSYSTKKLLSSSRFGCLMKP